MTEEEYFRKNFPDSCYGDKPLSPYWDYFQYGVEFGEQESEKKIEELKLNKKTVAHLADCLEEKMKERIEELETRCTELFLQNNEFAERFAKSTEIIKGLLTCCRNYPQENADKMKQAEQFLKGENIILEDAQAGNSPFDADEVFNKEMKAYTDEQFLELKEKKNAELKEKCNTLDKSLVTSTKNNIERQKIIDGLKEKNAVLERRIERAKECMRKLLFIINSDPANYNCKGLIQDAEDFIYNRTCNIRQQGEHCISETRCIMCDKEDGKVK